MISITVVIQFSFTCEQRNKLSESYNESESDGVDGLLKALQSCESPEMKTAILTLILIKIYNQAKL